MSERAGPTRRAVLLGALAAVVAACRPHHQGSSLPVAAPPDRPALETALGDELALLATYDATATAGGAAAKGTAAAFRGTHAEHVRALRVALGRPASASPSAPAATPVAERGLHAAESASARRLVSAAVEASDGRVAALLASIAASHSAMSRLDVRRVGAGP